MPSKHLTRLAAASLAAVFALTACSSSEAFDFTESSTGPAESIEFRVPDELIDLAGEYAERRVYESVTLTAVESDDVSECAVEYEFDYYDDGRERLIAYVEENPDDIDRAGDEFMSLILTGRELDDIEVDDSYTSAVVPVACAASPTDDEETASVTFASMSEHGDGHAGTRSFATAEVAVMQGGELHVQESELNHGWELDSNDNWIRRED